MAFPTEIYLDNDALGSVESLSYIDSADGLEKLQTGWTDLKMKICATSLETAAPIHASLEAIMVEEGATATYRGVIEGSNLSTHLAVYADLKVWIHYYRQQDYHTAREVTVRRYRTK